MKNGCRHERVEITREERREADYDPEAGTLTVDPEGSPVIEWTNSCLECGDEVDGASVAGWPQ